MLGLSGASGVGKTTLALAVSKKTGMPFVKSSVRGAYEKCGISPTDDVDFTTRMVVQMAVLEDTVRSYIEAKEPFITDRTPIDLIAYTLADVRRENLTESESVMLLQYIDECINATNTYFSAVVVIQPGIPMDDDGIRPASMAYAEHIGSIILGLVTDQRVGCMKSFVNRGTLNLDKRVAVINNVLNTVAKLSREEMKGQVIH